MDLSNGELPPNWNYKPWKPPEEPKPPVTPATDESAAEPAPSASSSNAAVKAAGISAEPRIFRPPLQPIVPIGRRATTEIQMTPLTTASAQRTAEVALQQPQFGRIESYIIKRLMSGNYKLEGLSWPMKGRVHAFLDKQMQIAKDEDNSNVDRKVALYLFNNAMSALSPADGIEYRNAKERSQDCAHCLRVWSRVPARDRAAAACLARAMDKNSHPGDLLDSAKFFAAHGYNAGEWGGRFKDLIASSSLRVNYDQAEGAKLLELFDKRNRKQQELKPNELRACANHLAKLVAIARHSDPVSKKRASLEIEEWLKQDITFNGARLFSECPHRILTNFHSARQIPGDRHVTAKMNQADNQMAKTLALTALPDTAGELQGVAEHENAFVNLMKRAETRSAKPIEVLDEAVKLRKKLRDSVSQAPAREAFINDSRHYQISELDRLIAHRDSMGAGRARLMIKSLPPERLIGAHIKYRDASGEHDLVIDRYDASNGEFVGSDVDPTRKRDPAAFHYSSEMLRGFPDPFHLILQPEK